MWNLLLVCSISLSLPLPLRRCIDAIAEFHLVVSQLMIMFFSFWKLGNNMQPHNFDNTRTSPHSHKTKISLSLDIMSHGHLLTNNFLVKCLSPFSFFFLIETKNHKCINQNSIIYLVQEISSMVIHFKLRNMNTFKSIEKKK